MNLTIIVCGAWFILGAFSLNQVEPLWVGGVLVVLGFNWKGR